MIIYIFILLIGLVVILKTHSLEKEKDSITPDDFVERSIAQTREYARMWNEEEVVEIKKLVSQTRVQQFLPRPQNFTEYVGNKEIKHMLRIMIDGAKQEKRILGHILLFGNAGLGKTSLSKVLANEVGAELIETTGGTITTQKKLLQLMWEIWNKQQNGKDVILFIDEIHRLACGEVSEEMWFPIFENYCFYHDLKGESIILNGLKYEISENFFQCNPFTIIGATTDPGILSPPLRDRFKASLTLREYSIEDLAKILKLYKDKVKFNATEEALIEIAKRGRGNPRQTISMFDICRDFALAEKKRELSKELVLKVVKDVLKLDELGLSKDDLRVLVTLAKHGERGVGLKTLSAEVKIKPKTLDELIFPFLTWQGFMLTSNARKITEKGLEYLERAGLYKPDNLGHGLF